MDKKMPGGGYRKDKNAPWLLLNRGTLRLASGFSSAAVEDFRLALEAIDYYGGKPLEERLGQLLLEDSVSAYEADDFEHLLAHIYFALSLIQENDLENAAAVLRGAEEKQQRMVEGYKRSKLTKGYRPPPNRAAKILLATLIEREDPSNAAILYKQVGMKMPHSGAATLVVIGHGGVAPNKVSAPAEAGMISQFALEMILSDREHPPAFSSSTPIKVPQLLSRQAAFPMKIGVDGLRAELQPIFSVSRAAYDELDQKMPVLAARAAARYLSRRGIVYAAQGRSESAGALTDLVMLFANAVTEADCRQWNVLPDSLTLTRFDLEAGEHELQLPTGKQMLTLKEGDLCVVQIFYPHPAVTYSLVPEPFLFSQGETL